MTNKTRIFHRHVRQIILPTDRRVRGRTQLQRPLAGGDSRGQTVFVRFGGLRLRRLPHEGRRHPSDHLQGDGGQARSDPFRIRRQDAGGQRHAGQFADDPRPRLQRHLLERGPVTPLRHNPGRALRGRNGGSVDEGCNCRNHPGLRVRNAALRVRRAGRPRTEMAPL
jgi:hypothetical protein